MTHKINCQTELKLAASPFTFLWSDSVSVSVSVSVPASPAAGQARPGEQLSSHISGDRFPPESSVGWRSDYQLNMPDINILNESFSLTPEMLQKS